MLYARRNLTLNVGILNAALGLSQKDEEFQLCNGQMDGRTLFIMTS